MKGLSANRWMVLAALLVLLPGAGLIISQLHQTSTSKATAMQQLDIDSFAQMPDGVEPILDKTGAFKHWYYPPDQSKLPTLLIAAIKATSGQPRLSQTTTVRIKGKTTYQREDFDFARRLRAVYDSREGGPTTFQLGNRYWDNYGLVMQSKASACYHPFLADPPLTNGGFSVTRLLPDGSASGWSYSTRSTKQRIRVTILHRGYRSYQIDIDPKSHRITTISTESKQLRLVARFSYRKLRSTSPPTNLCGPSASLAPTSKV